MSEKCKPQTTASTKIGLEGWKVFLETTPPTRRAGTTAIQQHFNLTE